MFEADAPAISGSEDRPPDRGVSRVSAILALVRFGRRSFIG